MKIAGVQTLQKFDGQKWAEPRRMQHQCGCDRHVACHKLMEMTSCIHQLNMKIPRMFQTVSAHPDTDHTIFQIISKFYQLFHSE